MSDISDIVVYQTGSQSSPTPVGYTDATNPLHPGQRIVNRFSHFSAGVYDLSPESHLSKLLKALLGDTGVGQLQKRLLLTRLQQSLGGTHFFDLDAFYGSLLGVYRRSVEQLDADPYLENVSADEWDVLRIKDASYRSRVEQFAKAINLGATAIGIEVAAEAILGVDCEVREVWTTDDSVLSIYSDVEAVGTYALLEGYSYAQLEQIGKRNGLNAPVKNRHKIIVYPKRTLTLEEQFDVLRVLERLRPAGTLIEVSATSPTVYRPIPVSVAYSDSEHWEVRSQVSAAPVNNVALYGDVDGEDVFIGKPVTPWAGYQGEAWSYIVENPSVIAYSKIGALSLIDKFDAQANDLPSQQSQVGADTITFLPQYALRPLQSIMSGRLMSEGILAVNPYAGTRDQPEFSAPGSLLVDGATASQLQVLRPLKDSTNRQGILYWTSPLRHWFDPTVDVVELRFPTPCDINHLSLQVSNYPHTMEIQAWVDATGTWEPLLTNTVLDSRPHSVNGVMQGGAIHPFHFGDNHWTRLDATIDPIRASVVRFVIRRFGTVGTYPLSATGPGTVSIPGDPDAIWMSPRFPGGMPVRGDVQEAFATNDWSNVAGIDPNGFPTDLDAGQREVDALAGSICLPPFTFGRRLTAYPIALRNVDVGYRMSSLDDLPVSPSDPNEPIVVTRNAAGQAVRHLLTRYPAWQAVDDSLSAWKSEPQPVPHAVVNLYLDTRAADGSLQVVDSFFIDPVSTGPTLNIYWTDAVGELDYATATPSADIILPSALVGNFPPPKPDTGLFFPSKDVGFIDFSNTTLHWTPTLAPWWIGTQFQTLLTSSAYTQATLFAAGIANGGGIDGQGEVSLRLHDNAVRFSVGAVAVSVPVSCPANSIVAVVAACTPVAPGSVTLTLQVKVGTGTVTTASATGAAVPSVPSTIRVGHGALNTTDPYPLAVRLLSANLTWGNNHSTFFSDPGEFSRGALPSDRFGSVDRNPDSPIAGAILRFSPRHISTKVELTGALANRLGFIGGQPNVYDDVEWVPVSRDYALRRGLIKVPPTAAAVWKFEFTSLVPEPYEPFLSIPRQVRLMPATQTIRPGSNAAVWNKETITALSLTGVSRFGDVPVVQDYTNRYSDRYTPTSGLVSTDEVRAAKASRELGFGFNLMPWQPNPLSPMFFRRGRHVYDTQIIQHRNKVAFFVGLRTVQPLRSDYAATDNTSTYIDHLWDIQNIASTTMAFSPGAFYTTAGPLPILLGSPQVVTSIGFASLQPVEAVQFATQQSDAAQLLTDDTFQSPALSTYAWNAPDSWQFDGDASVFYDAASKAVRITRDPDIASTLTGGGDPINRDIIDPVLATTRAVTPNTAIAAYGGLKSAPVTVSPRGMLHAACRVTVLSTLTAPLWLQIVAADGVTVVAERSFTPTPNVVTEHTLAYAIGTHPGTTGTVTTRVVQKGAHRGNWMIHALSLFDDGYVWEFSVDNGTSWLPALDIRNNQEGVLRFPNPGTVLRWRFTAYRRNIVLSMVKIKPWYSGRVLGRLSFPQRGPNLSIYDDEQPIQDDPDFTSWPNPIPQRWFAQYAKAFTIETETLFGSSTFAASFVRLAGDSASGTTDAATIGGFGSLRGGTEALTVTDTTSTARTFSRGASDSAPVSDGGSIWIYSDGIIQPVVDPPD